MLRANPKKGRKSKSLRVESPVGRSVIEEMRLTGGSDTLKPVAIVQAGQSPGAGRRKTSVDSVITKSSASRGLTPPKGHKRSTSTGHHLKADAAAQNHSQTGGSTASGRTQVHFATTSGLQASLVLHSSSNIPIPQPRPVSDEQLRQLYLQMYFHFHLSK